MSYSLVVQSLLDMLGQRYGRVVPFGRSRLFRLGDEVTCSVNYSKLLRGDKYFFGLSSEVVDPDFAFPDTVHGAFVMLVCGTYEAVLVLPRPLVLQMMDGVSTRRVDIFLEGDRYVMQTTKHPKLDVTPFLNAYPDPAARPVLSGEALDDMPQEEPAVRAHVAMQWALIRLGLAAGHAVWVPANDRHLSFGSHDFASHTLSRLPHLGFDEVTRRVVQNIDVLWMDRSVIRKAFEIESTTSVYSGLLRLNDLSLAQPNNSIDMYIAASRTRRDLVSRQVMRPSFRSLVDRCRFLGFEEIESQTAKLDSFGEVVGLEVRGLIQGEILTLPDHVTYPVGV